MSTLPSPVIKFDRVLNVRDFGGHSTRYGETVKTGTLFRGAHISKMSAQDRRLMSDLGINLVIDFRYKSERERQTTEICDVFSPEFMIYDPDHDDRDKNGLAPHEHFILHEVDGRDSARNYMLNSYAERPVLPGFIDLASRSLKHMATTGDTLYAHCAAGKDRTGTFAAIVLKTLGVSDEDVMKDYMLTAKLPGLDKLIAGAAKKMEARYGRCYDPDVIWPFFGVEPDYLAQSLTTIGNFDDYLQKTLGISDTERRSIISRYTA